MIHRRALAAAGQLSRFEGLRPEEEPPEMTPARLKELRRRNAISEQAYARTNKKRLADIERARRHDPAQLDTTAINGELTAWIEYQSELKRLKDPMLIEGGGLNARDIHDPFTFRRPRRRQPTLKDPTGDRPASIGSPFRRLEKLAPQAGDFFRSYLAWKDKPTSATAERVMEISRSMTKAFMDKLEFELKDGFLKPSSDPRALAANETTRARYIEAYRRMVNMGLFTGEGDLSPEIRDGLFGMDLSFGRTKTNIPKQRRKARSARTNQLNRTLYDEKGNVVLHEEGPLVGLPKLGISGADVLMGSLMGPVAAEAEVKPAMAELEYQSLLRKRELYEKNVRTRFRKKGEYPRGTITNPVTVNEKGEVEDPLMWREHPDAENEHGRFTTNSPFFKDLFKNDPVRRQFSDRLSELNDTRNNYQKAGQRLRSKRRAMGGPLSRRLAQANIQKAYDEGRYEEGQAIQKELEASLGGWGGAPSKPQTMSPFMRMIQEGKAPPKDLTRAMGGPIKRANMGMSQLAPNWASGTLPELAQHPDAVLVGEHGPEVFLPSGSGDIYPNHYNGGYLPQFHSGGSLPPHHGQGRQGHRINANGQEVYQDPNGRWRRVRAAGVGGNLVDPYATAPLPGAQTPGQYRQSFNQQGGVGAGPYGPQPITPIQGTPPVQPIAAAPVAAGGAPPGAPPGGPPAPPVGPTPGGGPNAAGPAAPRIRVGRATPVQQAQSLISASLSVGELYGQIEEVRREASNALQLSPVRALSVSVGQIFQERFGGRRGIRERESIARGAAGEATQLVRRLEQFQGREQQARSQARGFVEQARAERAATGAVTPETAERIRLARQESQRQAAGARLIRPEAETAIIRSQILERGERRAAAESDFGEARVRDVAAQMRARDAQRVAAGQRPVEGTGGILTTRNLLTAQGIGLAGIIAGTKIFTAGIQAIDAGLALANQAIGPWVDSLTNFTATANTVAEQMAQVTTGGTGGAAELAGAQAKIGLASATPELERRALLMGGAQNFLQIRDQLRADENFGNRNRMQGITTGFNNGPLAGVPVIGGALGFIGQQQSLAELLASTGRRQGIFAPVGGTPSPAQAAEQNQRAVDAQLFGNRTADTWLASQRGRMEPNFQALQNAGLIQGLEPGARPPDNFVPRFEEGTTFSQVMDALNAIPGQNQVLNAENMGSALGLTPEQIAQEMAPRPAGGGTPIVLPKVPVRSDDEQDQIDTVTKLYTELNDNLSKVNKGLGQFEVRIDDTSEATALSSQRLSETFSKMGLDELAQDAKDFGIVFTGLTDDLDKNVEIIEQALEDATRGGTMQSPQRLLSAMMPALTAQIRGIMRGAEFQRETVIPAQLSRQLAAQPLPSSGQVGLIPAGAGRFAGRGMLEQAAGRVQGLRDDLEAMALTDLQLEEKLGVPRELIEEVRSYGEEIRRMSEIDQDLQLGQEQAQYNEQLRISRRNISDLIGLTGRQTASYSRLVSVQDSGARVFDQQVIAASEYGRLQRAQIADSRQLANIQLARSQRELNLQLALARLRSPGETAAERAVRRREAEAQARSQQRELDINRRTTTRGRRIEDIGFRRQLGDALRAQGLTESERTINLRIRGSQAVQRALQDIQQQKLAFLDLGITVGEQLEEAAMRVQQTIEEASGQYLNDFEREVKRSMRIITREAIDAYEQAKTSLGLGGEESTPAQESTKNEAGRRRLAPGFIGMTSGPTRFLAGEAGSEAVVVIRNPQVGMLSGGGGRGGGGGGTVNIRIDASVRNDEDVDKLVRKVIREIHNQSELIVG